MIIKDIVLWLNPNDFLDKPPLTVMVKSNFITHYISKNVFKKSKFESEGYSLISIKGCQNPRDKAFITADKVLEIQVQFDEERYRSLDNSELNNYLVELIIKGLDKASKTFQIPISEIKFCLSELVESNFKNVWLHKEKVNKAKGLIAYLICQLTSEEFILTLKVNNDKLTLLQEIIIRDLPIETVFKHRYKNLIWNEDKLVVTDYLDRPNFEFSLVDILQGKIHVSEKWLEKK